MSAVDAFIDKDARRGWVAKLHVARNSTMWEHRRDLGGNLRVGRDPDFGCHDRLVADCAWERRGDQLYSFRCLVNDVASPERSVTPRATAHAGATRTRFVVAARDNGISPTEWENDDADINFGMCTACAISNNKQPMDHIWDLSVPRNGNTHRHVWVR